MSLLVRELFNQKEMAGFIRAAKVGRKAKVINQKATKVIIARQAADCQKG